MNTVPSIWLQTGFGLAFDLLDPRPEMVNFEVDVAESLARLTRFTGHVRSGVYSVAQHSVMGADALRRETGSDDLAAAFLLHDAHEAFLGDIATPVASAIAAEAGHLGGVEAGIAVTSALRSLKHRIDQAVHLRAGLSWPLPPSTAEAVKEMDLRMLATERRFLLGPSPFCWSESVERAQPIRIIGKFRVWPWPEAADAFRDRLTRYLHMPGRLTRRLALPATTPVKPVTAT
jgi:hypothetical protein